MTARLSKTMLTTVATHRLIEESDRILVAISGGKDSATLLDLLLRARRKAPVRFELVAFHLDQGQPGYDGTPLRPWLESLDVPFEIAREDTYSAVIADAERQEGATFCRLCSRLRRGILYAAAERLHCNKVALGHHRDDALETLLLNLFYSGKLQAMPAAYTTNDGRFRVIRPLIGCAERDIAAHAAAARYPILPCNLCGSQLDLKRVRVKRLLAELEREHPDLRPVMLAALHNVRPTHLLDHEVAEAWIARAGERPPRR
ncbi:MAG TPA: tRNA 2-thiocytidine(32) synthetase TtcA [Candidatus Polarisedimenticolaceae bacterium]|nr:tRNA 2-thiocytidine(32) synthetase TtcA [Candidatus Polarisedimenticolaceae bacterium]